MCGAHEQCHAMVALKGRLLCIKYAHQTIGEPTRRTLYDIADVVI